MRKLVAGVGLWAVLSASSIFWSGCEVNRITEVIATDTVTVNIISSDTIFVGGDTIFVVDSVFTVDTVVINDTTFVFDTTFVVDTLTFVRDLLEIALGDVVIKDGEPSPTPDTTAHLGDFAIPTEAVAAFGAEVWLDVSRSGNSQLDEAYGLAVTGTLLPQKECPIVPDNPTLGRDFELVDVVRSSVFAVWVTVGLFEVDFNHASTYECYPPVDDWKTSNSVHAHNIRFEYFKQTN